MPPKTRNTATGNLPVNLGDLAGEQLPQAYNDPGLLDDDPVDISAEEALASTLQQLGEDQANQARVIVYRMSEEKGRNKEQWLFETTAPEFAIDGVAGIARQYGGGQYRVRVFLKGGRGFLTQKVIDIAPDVKPAAAVAPSSQGITELAAVMAQGFQQLGSLIAQAVQRPPEQKESRAELLKEMALMRDMFAVNSAPASPAASMSDMMALLQQGIELGRMGGGEPSSMDVLSKAVDTLGPVLQAVASRQPAPVAVAPYAPPAVTPALGVAPYQANPVPEPQDMNIVKQQMLKQYLGFLVQQARNNCDPFTYAGLILDNLSDAEVSDLLSRPDWLDALASLNPDVKAADVAPWFGELKNAIITLQNESAAPGLTEPVQTGNTIAHATDSHQPNSPEPDVNPGPHS